MALLFRVDDLSVTPLYASGNYEMRNKIVLILLFTCSIIFAQDYNDDANWLGGFPVSKLRKSIKLIPNSTFLFADFNNIDSNSIPIYLINNSDSTIILDGYELAFLQQEHLTKSNVWVRSKPYYFGWCGTQYFYTKEIKPFHFIIIKKSVFVCLQQITHICELSVFSFRSTR